MSREMESRNRSKATSGSLPDIAQSVLPQNEGRLNRVGMGKVEALIKLKFESESVLLPALVDAYVSLDDPKAKGIHMSRMYKIVTDGLQSGLLTYELIGEILNSVLDSHEDLSESAFLDIAFQLPLKRKALVSDNYGLRHYPVRIQVHQDEGVSRFHVESDVTYSSTCPCSAALARQLIQENFKDTFKSEELDFQKIFDWLGSPQGIIATPHSQRSIATVNIALPEGQKGELPIVRLIDTAEDALQTAVQSIVKRVDEQEFAKLNGQNLMFCEDSARRLRKSFLSWSELKDFFIKVSHIESLHAHDAEAWTSKYADEVSTSETSAD